MHHIAWYRGGLLLFTAVTGSITDYRASRYLVVDNQVVVFSAFLDEPEAGSIDLINI